jgi:hypothetical protein
MASYMGTLEQQVADCRRRAQQLTSDLSTHQLTRRPEPEKWSIAECLAHLNVTAAVIQPKISAAIDQGKRDKRFGNGPFSPGPLGKLLIWIAEPPPKFKIPAPRGIVPQMVDGDPAQLVAEFMKFQDEWDRLIRASEGLDQNKLKIAPPFPRIPRLRLASPIPWMMAHQRRHLLQAEVVKRQVQPKPAGA